MPALASRGLSIPDSGQERQSWLEGLGALTGTAAGAVEGRRTCSSASTPAPARSNS
jgi:hypothetical protein